MPTEALDTTRRTLNGADLAIVEHRHGYLAGPRLSSRRAEANTRELSSRAGRRCTRGEARGPHRGGRRRA
jgi:hypothetical protein